MESCCKARVHKGQPRYQLPERARPQTPPGTLAKRCSHILKESLEALLNAKFQHRVDARALLSMFPRFWQDGTTPVCLVYHTDADGDFGSFRMVTQGDGQPALQCMTCDAGRRTLESFRVGIRRIYRLIAVVCTRLPYAIMMAVS